MNKIAILVDSASGLTDQELQQLNDVEMVEQPIIVNAEDELTDYSAMDESEFYQIIGANKISTSQVPRGQLAAKWQELLERYDQVLFLGISHYLSKQYLTALKLAETEPFKGRVVVYETSLVTVMLREMIYVAHRIAQANGQMDDILQAIEPLKTRHVSIFLIGNPDFLANSGRISRPLAHFCRSFKIIPMLQFKDGQIKRYGQTRSLKRAIKKALEEIIQQCGSEKLTIVTGLLDANRRAFLEKALTQYDFKTIEYCAMAKIIGVYLGPNMLGFLGWKPVVDINTKREK